MEQQLLLRVFVLGHRFWKPFWAPDQPKRRQEEPKKASKSSKKRKGGFSKRWFSHGTVDIFSLLRLPKTAPRGSGGRPRASRGAPKPQKKWTEKWTNKNINFWTNFGAIWEPIWSPKACQKNIKKESQKCIKQKHENSEVREHPPYSLRSLLTGHLKPSFKEAVFRDIANWLL